MWHDIDWGWGMAFHMLGWWLLNVIGIAALLAMIVTVSRRGRR